MYDLYQLKEFLDDEKVENIPKIKNYKDIFSINKNQKLTKIYQSYLKITQVILLKDEQNKLYFQKLIKISKNYKKKFINYQTKKIEQQYIILNKLRSSSTNVTLKLLNFQEQNEEDCIIYIFNIERGVKTLSEVQQQFRVTQNYKQYAVFLECAFFMLLQKLNKLHFIDQIAHSDIKPQNIVLGNDMQLYFIDFGESILLDNKSDYSYYLSVYTKNYNFNKNINYDQDFVWSKEEIIQCDTSQLIFTFLSLMCIRSDKKDFESYKDLQDNNSKNFLNNILDPFKQLGKYLCEQLDCMDQYIQNQQTQPQTFAFVRVLYNQQSNNVQVRLFVNKLNELYVQKQIKISKNEGEDYIDLRRKNAEKEYFILKNLKFSSTNVTLNVLYFQEQNEDDYIIFNFHIESGVQNLNDIKEQYKVTQNYKQYTVFLEYAFFNLLQKLNKLHFINEIAHSDIKPLNIVLGYDRQLYFIDFGESILLENKSDYCNYLYGYTKKYNLNKNNKKRDEGDYDWQKDEIIQCDNSQLMQTFLDLMCVRSDKKDFDSYKDLQNNISENFLQNILNPFKQLGKYLCECLNYIHQDIQNQQNYPQNFLFPHSFDNIGEIISQIQDIFYDKQKKKYYLYSINKRSIKIIDILAENHFESEFLIIDENTIVIENINEDSQQPTNISNYLNFCRYFKLRKPDILYLSENNKFMQSEEFMVKIMIVENNFNRDDYSIKQYLNIIKYIPTGILHLGFQQKELKTKKCSYDKQKNILRILDNNILDLLKELGKNNFEQIIQNKNIKYIIIISCSIDEIIMDFENIHNNTNQLFIHFTVQEKDDFQVNYFDVQVTQTKSKFDNETKKICRYNQNKKEKFKFFFQNILPCDEAYYQQHDTTLNPDSIDEIFSTYFSNLYKSDLSYLFNQISQYVNPQNFIDVNVHFLENIIIVRENIKGFEYLSRENLGQQDNQDSQKINEVK